AEHDDDTETLVEVLAWRGHLEPTFQARGVEDLLERAAALSRGLPLSSAVITARELAASARLKRGEVAEAVRRIEELRVAVEPAGFLWHADYIEALALTGARTEAAEVLAEVNGLARRLERDVVQLGLARAAALLAAVGGRPREAAQDLTDALRIWADHPYPF